MGQKTHSETERVNSQRYEGSESTSLDLSTELARLKEMREQQEDDDD
ncbi:hypothetical protein HUG10_21130 (plasmid) [Halorarum halophilum]|uniref:Uncharacterized protein n=1 Tax=Halorarum halophilum TaxID=2743090 RepID=A0A7D5GEW6_9EURY|nr:hypothetical protein [Halobaculum halophilum]QLG30092.1 hypothetical protein HUG10_21130 [Halobaculum halophilum]